MFEQNITLTLSDSEASHLDKALLQSQHLLYDEVLALMLCIFLLKTGKFLFFMYDDKPAQGALWGFLL